MKKLLATILALTLLCVTASALPVAVGVVNTADEIQSEGETVESSLLAENGVTAGQLIFHENFDSENTRVSGDAVYNAVGKTWNYVSPDVKDETFGYSNFRFLRGDSGYNGSALMTRVADDDDGYMWVRTDSSKSTTYPAFIFQFRDSNNKSIVVKEGTYTLCMKVYSPVGNGVNSNGIRARICDGVDAYGYRSGNITDPSASAWETYLPSEQGTWSYIWTTYTASESKPLSGFYVMNNGGNAEGKADFRSFYIDDVSLYYIPSDKTQTTSYTFTFVNGDVTTTKTAEENTKVTLPTLSSDREFLGWSEKENGTVILNTSLICIGDKTLYAVWGSELRTNPLINVEFSANAPVDAASYSYGMETTLRNFYANDVVTHAIMDLGDGTKFRRLLALKDGDLTFQFSGSALHEAPYVNFDDTKGAIVRLRLSVPENAAQPTGNLTVRNLYSLKEGGYLDPAATSYIDTSIVGKWQYVYFDYSSISGKNGSLRRFDILGLKKDWEIDIDYIRFVLDEDVQYDVAVPEVSVEKNCDGVIVKYTFDGQTELTSTEFDEITAGNGFGTSAKITDENGNTVYVYYSTLAGISGKTLPSGIGGLKYEAGKIGGIYLPYVKLETVKPTTIQLASIRTQNPSGLRVMGFTKSDVKEASDEIGFIIARADGVSNVDDLVFGNSREEGKANVNEKGIVYVYGSSYLKSSHDRIYALNSKDAGIDGDNRYKNLEGYFFTAALVGIPQERYDDNFICRPYIKSGGQYFYGEAITKNIRQVAQGIADSGYIGLNEQQIESINAIIGA